MWESVWEGLLTVVETGMNLREIKPYLKGSTISMWKYRSIVAMTYDFSQEAGTLERNFLIFERWQLSKHTHTQEKKSSSANPV